MDPQPQSQSAPPEGGRPFLGVHFVTCNVYGRLYIDPAGAAYVGRCPRCGAPVRAIIGEHGTKKRFFSAICP